MLNDANQSWIDSYYNNISLSDYDGSENIMNIMNDYGYKEQSELDSYIRWLNIDFEFTYNDIALNQYDGITYNLPDRDSYDTFVNDPRGFVSILQPILQQYPNIENDIIYNTIVRLPSSQSCSKTK